MPKIKTLLLAGGKIHDFQACGDAMQETLGAAGDFDLTRVNDDLSVLEGDGLDPYDLIAFYYTVGEITDTQKNGLLNWVASGKGYAGVHSA
ncbi:MAG: ThuA domain-containing protein, partial [Armatimonadota bacterium]